MAEWLSLSEVTAGSATPRRPVAWRGGSLMRRARFLDDVHAWRDAFATRAGMRFALYFDDAYEFACALFGAWQAGKEVWLPADPQPATVRRYMQCVDGCAGDLPGALRPLALHGLTNARSAYVRAAAAGSAALLDRDAATLVVYTSGSTGEPVAIVKRLAQLDAETGNLELAFGSRLARIDGAARPDSDADMATVYSTVSHQHIYGLLFHVLWPLAAGRPFVAERLAFPEEINTQPDPAAAARSIVLVSSPAHLTRLSHGIDWTVARGALRAVFSSGGPLPADASLHAQTLLGVCPIEVFGSSETGGIAWRQRTLQDEHWTPLPGVEWQLNGELLSVRSRHLPTPEWFETADRAHPLPSDVATLGFLLLGRSDRIVKIEEKRVSITAIERALARCAELSEARVLVLKLAAPPGERLAVVAVPTELGKALLLQGKRLLDERLRTAMLQTLERVAVPRRWRYVEALPLNSQGKSVDADLAALFRPLMPIAKWLSPEAASDDDHASAELEITPDLLGFDGHFPRLAMLPGVMLLDWAITLGRARFDLPPLFIRADGLKFKRPVSPGSTLTLHLRWQPDRHMLVIDYRSPSGVHAEGRLVFGTFHG
jgi:acyl-coenzyme A synthetase/AMP-(fatty) acid ligase